MNAKKERKKDLNYYLNLNWSYTIEQDTHKGKKFYIIRVNEIPGVCTDAPTVEKGMKGIKDALAGAIELFMEQGDIIPEPTSTIISMPKNMKILIALLGISLLFPITLMSSDNSNPATENPNLIGSHGNDGCPGKNGKNGQNGQNGGRGGDSDWGRGGDGGNGGDCD